MTEKIEKLFAMTETDIDCFKSWIRALGYGSISDARKAEQTMLGILQSLPLITGKPCGWIIASPANTYDEVEWHNEEMPEAGTKLYTHAQPLQQITELPKPIFTQVADGIEIGYNLSGGADIRLGGEFTYVKINYSHEYTDNATRTRLAENIVKLIQGEVPQSLQPITADMVTDEMIYDWRSETFGSQTGNCGVTNRDMIIAAHNAVIKGQTK